MGMSNEMIYSIFIAPMKSSSFLLDGFFACPDEVLR